MSTRKSSTSSATTTRPAKAVSSTNRSKSSTTSVKSKTTTRKQQKSVEELYHELFSKTHGDRIEWFLALQRWLSEDEVVPTTTSTPTTTKIERILYLGSYIHIGPSIVWPHAQVTYVDMDKKAVKFFNGTPTPTRTSNTNDGNSHDRHDEIAKLIIDRRVAVFNTNKALPGMSPRNNERDCNVPTPSFNFVNADYNDKTKLDHELLGLSSQNDDDNDNNNNDTSHRPTSLLYYDLLISSYAGFVSRAGKQYVKRGGLLIANNSHGDASLAYVDTNDWELIGVIISQSSSQEYEVVTSNLDQYMIPKQQRSKRKKRLVTTSTTSFNEGRKIRKQNQTNHASSKTMDETNDSTGCDDNDHGNNDARAMNNINDNNHQCHPSADDIIQLGRGIKYTKDAAAYIFRKL